MPIETDVCVAGGGPAGMLLGLLLARAGVKVLVLEQHANFEREYRGEVLMPRFTKLFRDLKLEHLIAKNAHLKLDGAEMFFGSRQIGRIAFDRVSPEIPYALWMPQPVLLQALFEEAKKYPAFEMWFDASAKTLIKEGPQTTGLKVRRGHEDTEVHAKITVGTDGRFSTLRRAGHFKTRYSEHQFDIVWFSIPKPANYVNTLRFFLSRPRNLLALPKYPDSIQCGLAVDKGEFARYKKEGIESIRKVLLKSNPLVHEFARNLKDFSGFHVLQAELDLIENWEQDGLLLVGDSAHTMSPVGAIGVSIAVETAAVAAGVIQDCLRKKDYSAKALGRVQEIREPEVRAIHKIQRAFSGLMLTRNGFIRALLPVILPIALKLPFAQRFQRRLAVLRLPLQIKPALIDGCA